MTKVQLVFAGQPAWSSEDLPALPKSTKPRSPSEATPESAQLEMELLLPSEDEFLTMTETEVSAFREELIKRAFRAVVDGRVSRKQRREWGEWIASDELHPFSFAVCAIETGVNPQELREALVTFIRRHHKSFAAEIPFTA
mgnify:CR=1 FL=1